jgi:flagellar assembly factor FliW
MEIQSKALGEIAVSEDQIFDMPAGMIGFPHLHRFALIPFADKDVPFFWWQSLDEASLCFILIEASLVCPDYHVIATTGDLAEIELSDAREGQIFVVVTVPENPREMTVNLMGPLVVNQSAGKAEQLVLMDSRYTTKHRLLPAEASDHACAHSENE